MLFSLYINQEMGRKEEISGNATLVFEAMKQLMALKYIDITYVGDERYTVLYHKMLLEQVPLFITSKRTLSRAISELKEADLIKYNGNNMLPAYTFTDKGISYITRNGATGGSDTPLSKNKIRKKPLFELSKLTRVSDLKPEYFKLLRTHCIALCEKDTIPLEEFDKFIDYHGSKGTKFTNYIRAFGSWIRKHKEFNKNKVKKSSNPNNLDNQEL